MTLPNFLIIGEHKAGTSSLHNYLSQHDDVYMPGLKEARFFAFDKNNPEHVRLVPRIFPISTLEEYEKLFDGVRDERAIGEASPNYFNTPGAETRIRDCIPEAKLIVSLRNPVDRLYSMYQMHVRSGTEKRAFIDAFREGKEEWWMRSSFPSANLQRYYDKFSKKQIKVILFDDLKVAPNKIIYDLFEFIGVNPDYKPDMTMSFNPGGLPKHKFLHTILQNLKSNQLLKATVKKMLPSSMIKSAQLASQKNMQKAPSLEIELRNEIMNYYRDDIINLEKLINRDLSSWWR